MLKKDFSVRVYKAYGDILQKTHSSSNMQLYIELTQGG